MVIKSFVKNYINNKVGQDVLLEADHDGRFPKEIIMLRFPSGNLGFRGDTIANLCPHSCPLDTTVRTDTGRCQYKGDSVCVQCGANGDE